MAAGQHEPIAVGPEGIGRVVPKKVLPNGVGNRCQGHRRARMATFGGLDRVHRECANGVDREAIDVGSMGRPRGGGGGGSHGTVFSESSV